MNKIDKIQNKINDLTVGMTGLVRVIDDSKKQYEQSKSKRNALCDEVKLLKLKLKEKGLQVTDHGIVRYLQNKYDLDIEALKEEIVYPYNYNFERLGDGNYMSDGLEAVIREGNIVTLIPKGNIETK